jgi:hypothetical protein
MIFTSQRGRWSYLPPWWSRVQRVVVHPGHAVLSILGGTVIYAVLVGTVFAS